MSEYKIISFDPSTTIMVWKLKNKTFQLSLTDANLTDYLSVQPSQYLDTSNNTIVLIQTKYNPPKLFENNNIYIRATQFEFDKWNYMLDKSYTNSKVYAILMKEMNESP
jgi:hypothetical protein